MYTQKLLQNFTFRCLLCRDLSQALRRFVVYRPNVRSRGLVSLRTRTRAHVHTLTWMKWCAYAWTHYVIGLICIHARWNVQRSAHGYTIKLIWWCYLDYNSSSSWNSRLLTMLIYAHKQYNKLYRYVQMQISKQYIRQTRYFFGQQTHRNHILVIVRGYV